MSKSSYKELSFTSFLLSDCNAMFFYYWNINSVPLYSNFLLRGLSIENLRSSADIWSVGCTVIEMATGKPPWSQKYQEVAALFYIGTTKSHPPIPAHLSAEAKDFLLKCLQKEPDLRPAAYELLKHPFVTGEYNEAQLALQTSVMENSETPVSTSEENLPNPCSTGYPENSESKPNWGTSSSIDDMCQIDDKDDVMMVGEVKFNSILLPDNFNKSFNPISEPSHDWSCEIDGNLRPEHSGMDMDTNPSLDMPAGSSGISNKGGNDFSFPCGPSVSEDDDEVTESKIRDFLDEKVLFSFVVQMPVHAIELKKLQTPLYEEFYNTLNAACSPSVAERTQDENVINYLKLPPKKPFTKSGSNWNPICGCDQTAQDTPSPPHNDWKGLLVDSQQEPNSPSVSFYEIQRKWKEELDQELERKREMMRQAGKTSSPKDRALNRPRERSRFASPGK
ncbi:Mitogen-activated protein kinase kinase kinase NPK1 [Vitis vinifera]|uniref:Mitogen-activated protein kinase kinase kinase NPK1 n=1 Tax=Vitis vinifera TaxID=29760 RepID=A0A438F0D7_VITVI|nr:Mitogen-activated protein kinase kinase kinase NPK1 [Vitis vinifera]